MMSWQLHSSRHGQNKADTQKLLKVRMVNLVSTLKDFEPSRIEELLKESWKVDVGVALQKNVKN